MPTVLRVGALRFVVSRETTPVNGIVPTISDKATLDR